MKRVRLLRTIPKTTPAKVATRTVAAVEADRRHVRHPLRLALNFWLGESPRRVTELLLSGIRFDVPTSPAGTHRPGDGHREHGRSTVGNVPTGSG